MKQLLIVSLVVAMTCCFCTAAAQELATLRAGQEVSLPSKITNRPPEPLPAGTYTVGTLGDFPTITWAFDRLSNDGVAGEVTLELIDASYIVPVLSLFTINGPIPGAGPDSRVTIKPAANTNVTVEGSGLAVFWLANTSYLTIDGVGLTGPTTLTMHARYSDIYQYNDCIDLVGNADHNVIQNVTFLSDDIRRGGSGVGCFSTGLTSAPDDNLIQNNLFLKAGIAIYVSSYNSNVASTGNIVRGNVIGSDAYGLITWGIQVEMNQNAIVENNIIQNIRQQFPLSVITHGINSYAGTGCIIRNNVVHNIVSNDLWGSTGILLSGGDLDYGLDEQVYNNMIYDIQSTSPVTDSRVTGIQLWAQRNPKIYNNTVSLSGTGTNRSGSAALYVHWACSNVEFRNNISLNMRDESPYCASAVYSYGYTNLFSDNNNLLYDPNQYNCLVTAGNSDYHTLGEWQVMGRDFNSMSEIANFSLPDLHINTGYRTLLDGHATPLPEVSTDIDGDIRDPSIPDIGADEFGMVNATVWQLQTSQFPSDVMVVDLSAVNDDVCWAIGQKVPINALPYEGYIRTDDGGTTWLCDSIPGLTNSYLAQIFPIDATTAYATAYKVAGQTGSRGVYRTTDAGSTWDRQSAYNFSQIGPTYIHFFDARNGVVIGNPGLESYTTSDGGEVWSRVTMPSTLDDESTLSIGDAICASGNSLWFATNRRLFTSTDMGNTWTWLLNEPAYYDWRPVIAFQDPQTGIYTLKENPVPTGAGHLYRKTTNGGMNWTVLSDPILDNLAPTSVQYIPGTASTYIVTGGGSPGTRGTALTTDAGETWTLIDTIGALSVHFASDMVGWGSQWEINQIQKYVGPRIITSVKEQQIAELPAVFMLAQNYPNPFNPSTTIRYSVPIRSEVVLKVFGILGNEIVTLIDEEKSAGTYEVTWNDPRLASGVYFYRLTAGQYTQTRKMVLMK